MNDPATPKHGFQITPQKDNTLPEQDPGKPCSVGTPLKKAIPFLSII
jgi:hypothetical protein